MINLFGYRVSWSQLAWFGHRASGLGVLLYLFMHIVETSTVLFGPEVYNAAVGIFTLLVGAAVRARRPTDQATLHFFWLSVAFFGLFTFSFSGRLDRVDWVFYWGDAIAVMVRPPLFVHFALVFPVMVIIL